MSPKVVNAVEDAVEYSFALEYDGPPITRELPRALPINVDRIPVAAVVSPMALSGKFSLPVVQPISAADIMNVKPSTDLKLSSSSAELLTVSPTSVIAFESRNNEASEGSCSKELGLGTETSVSPSSVHDVSGEREPETCHSNGVCALSGELSSDFECSNPDGRANGVNGRAYSSTSRDLSCEFVGGVANSGLLGSSDSFEKSREFSGSLHTSKLAVGFKDSLDFNESNRTDWESNESVLSMGYLSSGVSSRNFGDGNHEHGYDMKRGPMVTFCGIKSDDGNNNNNDEFSNSDTDFLRVKKEPAVRVKKGACYRCLKGNRFTEKEICLVCDAKYCSNCVLRAMGSMPEGRKCVTCIGFPIDESKRGSLGKCSRMLKRLLNDLEVRQMLRAEKLCEINQLPPEYIYVNGRPLYNEELVVLQGCPNPPKKLKPGKYWYDKVSGLWGKEGQKPSQVISPHLNVGGPIKADASNGNSQVYINGREITNLELRILKLSGVQCAGNPHFWVNEDGSYQEEGQKNTKGYIWGKAGTKLLCSILSLPVPSKSSHPSSGQLDNALGWIVPDYLEQRGIQKLLLIGNNGSGTSTIFKQAKIIYNDTPFSEDEREHIKFVIQSHVYSYIGILLEGRERFEEMHNQSRDGSTPAGYVNANDERTPYTICPRLKAFSDWLLRVMASGTLEEIFPAASREYAPLVEELWNNAAFQATYKRKSELENLPSVASYFLERVVEILNPDYKPSDMDILYAEHVTSSNGLSCMDFSFPQSSYDDDADTGDLQDSLLRFQLIRVQAKGFGENCKWLEMFEDVQIVVFCVSLSDYDQLAVDANGKTVNKMLLSKKFFENMVTHPTFDQIDFLLLLNKFDLFEEKIEQVPLTTCDWFDDFRPVMSRNHSNNSVHPTLGQLGFHYIAVKFKRLYSALAGRKLFVSLVNGLERNSVDGALKYAREILRWDEERPNFSLSEYSIHSTEPNSLSH